MIICAERNKSAAQHFDVSQLVARSARQVTVTPPNPFNRKWNYSHLCFSFTLTFYCFRLTSIGLISCWDDQNPFHKNNTISFKLWSWYLSIQKLIDIMQLTHLIQLYAIWIDKISWFYYSTVKWFQNCLTSCQFMFINIHTFTHKNTLIYAWIYILSTVYFFKFQNFHAFMCTNHVIFNTCKIYMMLQRKSLLKFLHMNQMTRW